MDKNFQQACRDSIAFVRNFLRVYLEERDFDFILSKLHKDISWFGTGSAEICKSHEDAVSLLKAEKESSDVHFKIIDQWYEAVPISDCFCAVYCSVKLVEDSPNEFLMEMDSRHSIVCAIDGEDIKAYHIHSSVPNAAQADDEFVNMSIVRSYNTMLESKLVERTKLLQDKTEDLEALANNIYGGVEVCLYDDCFTLLYLSDGFTFLTGYSKHEAIGLLGGKHISLMFEEDIEYIKGEIASQLAQKNSFSVEYRIKRKDGRIIWVLDKGVLINSSDSPAKVQCILTDITSQKETEQALRISEKRYEIAIGISGITMFEYNVVTKELLLFENDAVMHGVETLLQDGCEALISRGVVYPEYIHDFREMYRKINEGEPTASCSIKAGDVNGETHEFELTLTNVFDDNGKPIRAIGVRKNVTQLRQLERELEYSNTMSSNQTLTYEANITRNMIVSFNSDWAKALEVDTISSYSELVAAICKNYIFSDDAPSVSRALSSEAIIEAFENGRRLVAVEYRIKFGSSDYHWYKNSINIIKDNKSGDISVRCYIADINEDKARELKAIDERRLYESMVSKAVVIYEVNITKNIFIRGHEKWYKLFGISQTSVYSEMIDALGKKAVHPDDIDRFNDIFLRQKVLDAYSSGQYEVIDEYRRPDESGNFIWVRCSLHLFEDPQTGDLKGNAYIENINAEKTKQLDLIYTSEHDALTGLYNKAATEKHTTEFLSTSEGKAGLHAFFIIDIDYFKSVNDSFGHAFGDAVLSQFASKINCLFRDIDILGRVGGDEFIALMKNVGSHKAALAKAKEIHDKVSDSFTKSNIVHSISASIGIAFYKEHGKTYEELYTHSDTALYVSKKSGRNRYTTYSPNMGISASSVKEINQSEFTQPKVFEENTAEYVFRILYESNNKAAAINNVLELVGKQYDMSRAYIFEVTSDSNYVDNTFEWCAQDISPQKDKLQKAPFKDLGNYEYNFIQNGTFVVPDVSRADPALKAILEPQGIKTMFQFSIVSNSEFKGYIGFDECKGLRVLSRTEIIALQNISNILSIFITEMRAVEETVRIKEITSSIIDKLTSCTYVCDPQSYEILFINEKTFEILPKAKLGSLCFSVLWNRTAPCEDCAMKTMKINGLSSYSMVFHNSNLGALVKVTSSWIDWLDGHQKCIIDSVDLSKDKK